MKKVLFVSTVSSVFHEPFLRAFRDLGFSVEFVDYREHPVLEIGNLIHRAVGRLPERISAKLKDQAQKKVDSNILAKARQTKPNIIFVSKAKDIAPLVLKELREIGTTLNYYPETMDHWETISELAPKYDYFLNYDPYVVELLHKQGYQNALYVPFSADIPENSQWSLQTNYPYNITFIGSYHPVRYAEREEILKQVKDLGLHIWGNKAWLDTSLREHYQGRPSTEEMLDIYRKSKMVINVDLLSSFEGTGVNLRPFEITSSGAMLLNHDDRKDIFNLFKEGKEFVSFHGSEDIREKIAYYLNHEEERARIARAGFERTRDAHTYVSRLRDVFESIQTK